MKVLKTLFAAFIFFVCIVNLNAQIKSEKKLQKLYERKLSARLSKGMVFKAVVIKTGKIRKEGNPNSMVVTEVFPKEVVLLFDYDYNSTYWVVNKGQYFGYINDMYLATSSELEAFKYSLLPEEEKARLKENEIIRNRKEKEQNEAQEKRMAKRNLLIGKYGDVIGQKLFSGKIWLGITDEMVKDSWGDPEDINRSVGSWGVNEQWVYPHEVYLYFENGKLTSWQE